jgi:hypothetical protein
MDQRLAVQGTSSTTYYYIIGRKNKYKYTLTNQYPVLHVVAFSSVAVVHMYVAALVVVVPQIVQTSAAPVPTL